MSVDRIRDHFEAEAGEFDRIILNLIPDYPEMVEAIVAAIPFDRSARLEVIDLGCGTGTVAQAVLAAFPHAHLTCLDLAEKMVAVAQTKLRHHRNVSYITGNFENFEGRYDVVLSSLALHHLQTDEDKRRFYRRVYENLASGGAFYNADLVLASSAALQQVYLQKWRAFMKRAISEEEIDTKWIPKYLDEDRPAKLLDQLSWLVEIGFAYVDVLWKHYNFAVYGGLKR